MAQRRERYWVVIQRKDKRQAQHWKLSCWNEVNAAGDYPGSVSRARAAKELPGKDKSVRLTWNYKIVRRVKTPSTR